MPIQISGIRLFSSKILGKCVMRKMRFLKGSDVKMIWIVVIFTRPDLRMSKTAGFDQRSDIPPESILDMRIEEQSAI